MKTFTIIIALISFGVVALAADPAPVDYQSRLKEIGEIAKSAGRDNRELKKLLGESVSINNAQGAELTDVRGQIVKLSDSFVKVQEQRDKAVEAKWLMFWYGASAGSAIWLALYLARRSKSRGVPLPTVAEVSAHPADRRRGRKVRRK